MAMRVLATADTPHTKPTGNRKGPDWSVFSRGKKIATCAADRMARPAISVLLLGFEKLFSFAASCRPRHTGQITPLMHYASLLSTTLTKHVNRQTMQSLHLQQQA